jgi:PAS domain S-box-containing protein
VVGERGANEDILEKLEEVAATLPVILILPESDQDFANSALRTGAQDCLVSAELDSDTLMRSLHHAIARNRNRMGLKLAESEQRLQAFRESQAFYHSLVKTLTQGIFRKDRHGRFTFVNENFCRNTDHAPSDFLGKTDFDFFPEELARKYHEDDMAVIKLGKGTDEVELFEAADGRRLVIRTIKTPVRDAEGEIIGLQGIFWDITAEKQAEEALAASQERFELAVRGSNDGIWDWNIPTGEVYFSDRFKELLGHEPDGFDNLYESFESPLHPDDHDATVAAIESHLKERVRYDVECRLRTKGGAYKWFHARGLATWDAKGNAKRMCGSISDVTKRKKAEETLLQRTEELERSNKDLEQFAWVASHDLKEPLRAVSNYVQLLERRYGDLLDGEGKRFIGFAVDGAKRMRQLINDLLAFSRIGTRGKKLAPIDSGAALARALKSLALVIEETGAEVTTETLPVVWGDKGQLAQVFQNLIGNAIKFCETEPRITVSATRADNGWRFFVSDNGIGMEKSHLEKVFEVFQRLHTRERYNGTGIGLAVVRKIVERHGGKIRVESVPGEGSVFSFTLKAD